MKNDNFVGTMCNKCRNPTCICKNVKTMKNKNLIGISGKKRSGKNTVADIIQYLTSPLNKEMTSFGDFKRYFKKQRGFELNYEQKSFAYKLKQIVSLLTGVPVEDLEKEEVKNSTLPEEWWYYKHNITNNIMSIKEFRNWVNKEFYTNQYILIKPTYRQVLQQLGTDLLRDQLHPNVHINGLFVDYKEQFISKGIGNFHDPRINNTKSIGFPKWIITDPRFSNEIEKIKEYNGITIRIERNTEFRLSELWSEFQSQNKYDSWDDYLKSINKFDVVYHKSETALDNYTEFDYVIHNNSNLDSLIEEVRKILIKEKII